MLAKRWAFTINNFQEHIGYDWKNWLANNLREVAFLVCEEEIGAQGTPHLQGYVRFSRKLRFSQVKKMLGMAAHLEIAKGTELENYNYCIKENNNVYQIGEPRNTVSKKSKFNWMGLINDYRDMDWQDFIEKYPRQSLQYRSKLQELQVSMEKPQVEFNGDLTKKNFWIYGPPRTGKSRWARSQSNSIYLKLNNKWWQFYNKEKVVLLEDFPSLIESGGVLGSHMKLWADRYSFTAEQKNSSLIIHPKTYFLIVTSNYSIEECFRTGDVEAIKARFHEINVKSENDIVLQFSLDMSVIQN